MPKPWSELSYKLEFVFTYCKGSGDNACLHRLVRVVGTSTRLYNKYENFMNLFIVLETARRNLASAVL